MCGGRDRDARLSGAASEHDLQPELVGSADHRVRFRDTAALLKLHVDSIARAGEPIDVSDAHGGFVRDDRQRAALFDPAEPLDVGWWRGLLDELDVELDDAIDAA